MYDLAVFLGMSAAILTTPPGFIALIVVATVPGLKRRLIAAVVLSLALAGFNYMSAVPQAARLGIASPSFFGMWMFRLVMLLAIALIATAIGSGVRRMRGV